MQALNFDGYPVLRMSDVPPMEVAVISTDDPPTGIGEAGVPAVAPAIANAVAMLTGKRLRHLPMTPDRVKQSLGSAFEVAPPRTSTPRRDYCAEIDAAHCVADS